MMLVTLVFRIYFPETMACFSFNLIKKQKPPWLYDENVQLACNGI
jgi:hypothetical protein